MPKRPYPAWRRRHDAVLLYVIARPSAKQTEIAAATGYTPSQISRILNSPDFTERYERVLFNAAAQARYDRLRGRTTRNQPYEQA